MTLSMTAFARHEVETGLGTLIWEVRTVNHRYLELAIRLDEIFRPLEMQIRKLFSERLSRGKVEAVLRYQPPQHQQAALEVDMTLANAIIQRYQQLSDLAKDSAPIDLMRVLQWPGMILNETPDQTELNTAVITCLQQALNDLVQTRQREGLALQGMIEQRCHEVNHIAEQVRQRLPDILTQHKQRLAEKVAELQVNLDPERLEQEMVLLAQKSDVAEELDRLQNHVVEVLHVLKRKEPIGRRLDFLMQELNREANTLGSKSIDIGTTRYSVDLKVLIEQMREQIQNIE